MEERITLGDSATPLVLIGGGLATALSPSLGEASPAVAEEQSNSFQSTFVVQPEESEVPEISTNQEAATRQQVRAQRSTVDPPQTEVLPAVLDELLSSPLHEPVATAQAGIESPELPVTEIQKAEPRGSFVPASNANTGSPAPTGDGEVASFGSGTLSAQATVAPIPTQHSEIQSLQIESQSEPAADSGSSIDTGGKFFVTSFGGGENEEPSADEDEYSVLHDTTLTVSAPGVMDNDSDPDSDPIFAVLDAGPSNGGLNYFNSDGSFEYVPNANWTGFDAFTYHVNDGLDDSDIATVTIDVANEDPWADDDEYSVLHDTTLVVSSPGVMDNDGDLDSDPISAELDVGPTNGTLTYFNSDGSFEYVPNTGWSGIDTFTYQVNDGLEDGDIAEVEIDVTNEIPWAEDDEYGMLRDTTLTVSSPGVLDNDGDNDSDPISAALDVGPNNGTLTYFNSDGSFEYVPNAGWSGIDSFT